MKNGLQDIDGFIIPFTSISQTNEWIQLADRHNKTIYGWRIIPQDGRDPRVSVQQAIGFLKGKNYLKKEQTVFIDARKTFNDDCKLNQRFVVEMYDELQMHLGGPQRIGVMAKRANWMDKMCNMKWDHIKLWYINQNNKTSFADYMMFGGWKEPFAKQYQQKTISDSEDGDKYAASLTFM